MSDPTVPQITQADLDDLPTPAPVNAPDAVDSTESTSTSSEISSPVDVPETGDAFAPDSPFVADSEQAPSAQPEPAPSAYVGDEVVPTSGGDAAPTAPTPSDSASGAEPSEPTSDTPIFEGQVSGQGVDPSSSPVPSEPSSTEPGTSPEPASSTSSSSTDSPEQPASEPQPYYTPAGEEEQAQAAPAPTTGADTEADPSGVVPGKDGYGPSENQPQLETENAYGDHIEPGPGVEPDVSLSPSPAAPGGADFEGEEDLSNDPQIFVQGEENEGYDDGESHEPTFAHPVTFEEAVSGYTPRFRGTLRNNNTVEVQRADWIGPEVLSVDIEDIDELVALLEGLAGKAE